MKKYFFNDGTSQQGPFTIEELKEKNITSETPVWYDGLPDWTTAGQLEELKEILVHTPPPIHPVTAAPVEQTKPETPVIPVTAVTTPAAATVMAAKPPVKSSKKKTAWVSYVLALVVLGGVGYLVYQDMEKNKDAKTGINANIHLTDSTTNTAMQQPSTEQPTSMTSSPADDTAKNETTPVTSTEPETTSPATTTTTTVTPTTTQPAAVTPAKTQPATLTTTKTTIKDQQAEAQRQAKKKAEEEKQKLQAARAVAEKEKEYRNNWPRYITVGKLDYTIKDDGVEPFNVPVYNGTNATVDKVTVLVEYMKKEKKVLKSETMTVYNIPPGSGVNGKAAGFRKGNNVKVSIVNIINRKLHFCYPAGNGIPGDPYYCN